MLVILQPILDELRTIDTDVRASQAGAATGLEAIVAKLKTISSQLAELLAKPTA